MSVSRRTVLTTAAGAATPCAASTPPVAATESRLPAPTPHTLRSAADYGPTGGSGTGEQRRVTDARYRSGRGAERLSIFSRA